ncbi:MAG: DUF424 family protein [archaeon]
MFHKIHSIREQKILAACDSELSGKILDKKTGFTVKPEFYGKEKIDEKKLIQLIKKADSVNLVGKKSVGVALKEKIAEEKNVIKINKVPHLQIYFLPEENK